MRKSFDLGDMFGDYGKVYVLTSETGVRGAYEWIHAPKEIGKVVKNLGYKDAWIIPSSKHELLLIPGMTRFKKEELEEMHRGIQESAVAEEDRLCDEVWNYSGGCLNMTLKVG